MRWRAALFLVSALALASCRHGAGSNPPIADVRLYLETGTPGGTEWVLPQSGVRVLCAAEPTATAADLVAVEVVSLELGEGLLLQLNAHGVDRLDRQPADARGRRLVLVVNGGAVGVVRLTRPVTNGRIVMFVEVPESGLPALVASIRPALGSTFWQHLAP